jgi:phosphohistidine phosphatase SixA
VRGRTAAALVALALALAGCGSEAATLEGEPRAAPGPDLTDAVLVLRHALTEPKTDRPETVGDCARQRNLTAAGREQARALGRALERLGFVAAGVRASPMCRTMQTAELAFGRATADRRLLQLATDGTARDDDRRVAALRRLVRESPPGTVLVTHTPNVGEAFGESLVEGEALVFRGGRKAGRVPPP